MILGSHNSWSYLSPKKWWMKPFAFVAKCQDKSISEQFNSGVRCFDLRVRFENKKLIVAHGAMQYKIDKNQLLKDLNFINNLGGCYVRILHEVRSTSQRTSESVAMFKEFCKYIEETYTEIKFWYGKNLVDGTTEYEFSNNPSCEEKYSSVCPPKIIDDWIPVVYAKLNNKKILEKGTDKDILLIDFV